MQAYLDLLRTVLEHGQERPDRTGTGTRSIFGYQLRVRLDQGFPLLTTKKLHTPSIIHELLWFLRGDSNVAYLQQNGVRIWNEWADENGELGPIYGKQWRSWPSTRGEIDQISELITAISKDPASRRLVISAWNVGQLHEMKLAPCHCLFQFYVHEDKLSCQLYQRSADVFLGVPFNIASYALLTAMVAQVCGLKAYEFIHSFGDAHLYLNHIAQAELQLARTPLPAPTLWLNPAIHSIFDFRGEDIRFENYQAHPHIPAKVSI